MRNQGEAQGNSTEVSQDKEGNQNGGGEKQDNSETGAEMSKEKEDIPDSRFSDKEEGNTSKEAGDDSETGADEPKEGEDNNKTEAETEANVSNEQADTDTEAGKGTDLPDASSDKDTNTEANNTEQEGEGDAAENTNEEGKDEEEFKSVTLSVDKDGSNITEVEDSSDKQNVTNDSPGQQNANINTGNIGNSILDEEINEENGDANNTGNNETDLGQDSEKKDDVEGGTFKILQVMKEHEETQGNTTSENSETQETGQLKAANFRLIEMLLSNFHFRYE